MALSGALLAAIVGTLCVCASAYPTNDATDFFHARNDGAAGQYYPDTDDAEFADMMTNDEADDVAPVSPDTSEQDFPDLDAEEERIIRRGRTRYVCNPYIGRCFRRPRVAQVQQDSVPEDAEGQLYTFVYKRYCAMYAGKNHCFSYPVAVKPKNSWFGK